LAKQGAQIANQGVSIQRLATLKQAVAVLRHKSVLMLAAAPPRLKAVFNLTTTVMRPKNALRLATVVIELKIFFVQAPAAAALRSKAPPKLKGM
jgi:hypothetical protein